MLKIEIHTKKSGILYLQNLAHQNRFKHRNTLQKKCGTSFNNDLIILNKKFTYY
jgi:hypothetical protein